MQTSNNFRLYKDLGTVGTFESATDALVATVAGNPTTGTVTFGSLVETIGTAGTHYIVIYNAVNALSVNDQITASIGSADLNTDASSKSGNLTSEPTHPVGGQSGATWAAAEDTVLTGLAKTTTKRLRIAISNEAAASGNVLYRLEVSDPNPATCDGATYTRVDTSTHWSMVTSTQFADGDPTANLIPGLTDPAGKTFVAGQSKESNDETTGISLSGTGFTEIEYALQATASATGGALYCFRLTDAGTATNFTYTEAKYGQVTVAGANNFLVEAAGGGNIATQNAGGPFNIQITARDFLGNTAISFTGVGNTVEISSTGALSGGSGTTATFTNGVLSSHSVTISNIGSFTITATDSAGGLGTGNETGISNAFTVNAGALGHFLVEAFGGGNIGTQMATVPFNIRITAQDANNNTVTSFDGVGNTVQITSTGTLSGGSGTTATFTNGVLTSHSVTISNTGSFTITATKTSGSEDGISNLFTVNVATVDLQQVHYRWRNDDGGESGAGWYDPSWNFRKKITVDFTKVDADQSNFPVYVNLADLLADFFANVESSGGDDGGDIRVTQSDGVTELPREVVAIDTGAETGELHFEANSLSSTVPTDFYIYYGNAAASEPAASAIYGSDNVWSNGYAGLWHLGEEQAGATGTADVYADSTGKPNGGDDYVSATGQGGQIPAGQEFDGLDDYVDAGTDTSLDMGSGDFTLSAWIQTTSTTTPMIAGKGGNNAGGIRYDLRVGPLGELRIIIDDNVTKADLTSAVTGYNDGAWHHLVGVRDGTNLRLYVDGTADTNSPLDITGIGSLDSPRVFSIGSLFDEATLVQDDFFGGLIDEVRVSNVVRTAGWIGTEHNNQLNPGTGAGGFLSGIGSQETPSAGATWAANEDTELTGLLKLTTRRLRLEISSAGAASGSVLYRLQVSQANPATCDGATYTRVDTSSAWNMITSIHFADGDPSINISDGLSDANTTFVAGQLKESTDETAGITLGVAEFTEIEYALQATASAVNGATYCFRLTDTGVATDFTYTETKYGKVTLGGPDLQQLHYRWRNDDGGEGKAWWSTSYAYRQQITITAGSAAVPNGYSVSTTFNHAGLVTATKSQTDGDDIRVLYWNGVSWVELDRALDSGSSWDNASTKIWFKSQAAISAAGSDTDYYLYYGNTGAVTPPANKANIFLFSDDFEAGNLSKWTVVNGLWQIATDQPRSGTYAVKYPAEADSAERMNANPALDEADVYVDAWWRMSAPASTDVSQGFRRSADSLSSYETNLEGAAGWNIAKEISDTWSELLVNAGTPAANTWTRMGIAIDGTGMRVFKDGAQLLPASGSFDVGTELASGNIGFKKWAVGAGEAWWIDDVVARKYVDPEPTTGLGSESGGISHNETLTDSGAATDTLTVTNVGSGTDQLYLAAVAIYETNRFVSSISGGGLTWTLQKRQCAARITNPWVEVWQAFGSPTSSFTATVNMDAITDRVSAAVSRYSGADPTTPTEGVDGSNTEGQGVAAVCGSGTDTLTMTLSLTSSRDNSVLYVASHPRNTTISTPDVDYTQRVFISNSNSGDGANLYVHDRTLATAGSDTATHTLGSIKPWDMAGLVINPLSGSGADSQQGLAIMRYGAS